TSTTCLHLCRKSLTEKPIFAGRLKCLKSSSLQAVVRCEGARTRGTACFVSQRRRQLPGARLASDRSRPGKIDSACLEIEIKDLDFVSPYIGPQRTLRAILTLPTL
ncbi:unnamed protein product, partial [Ixodes pacificus]